MACIQQGRDAFHQTNHDSKISAPFERRMDNPDMIQICLCPSRLSVCVSRWPCLGPVRGDKDAPSPCGARLLGAHEALLPEELPDMLPLRGRDTGAELPEGNAEVSSCVACVGMLGWMPWGSINSSTVGDRVRARMPWAVLVVRVTSVSRVLAVAVPVTRDKCPCFGCCCGRYHELGGSRSSNTDVE